MHYDGCPIADLGLNFTLPGHASIELRRGSRDTAVTIQNLHQYVTLVTQWFLVEGVQAQFEALREGETYINYLQFYEVQHLFVNFLCFQDLIRYSNLNDCVSFILKKSKKCCAAQV